jgi:hypothetical protein
MLYLVRLTDLEAKVGLQSIGLDADIQLLGLPMAAEGALGSGNCLALSWSQGSLETLFGVLGNQLLDNSPFDSWMMLEILAIVATICPIPY